MFRLVLGIQGGKAHPLPNGKAGEIEDLFTEKIFLRLGRRLF